jgi:hypothetical protein
MIAWSSKELPKPCCLWPSSYQQPDGHYDKPKMKMSTPNGRWQINPPLDGNYESKAVVSEAGDIIRCALRSNRLHDSRTLESRGNVPGPKKTD